MNKLFYYACTAFLAGSAALTAVSCAEDDLNNYGGTDNGDLVRFSVNDVQEDVISGGAKTRGAITPGLGSSDLAGQKLEAQSSENLDVCLIETTVEGVNPVKADAQTRADIIRTSTLGDFSSSAIRGKQYLRLFPEWFHAEKTRPDGTLYSKIYWSMDNPKARFFAVHPSIDKYPKMTIGKTDVTGRPAVDFTVDPDVKKQVDLMTACTGDVEYTTRGVHPTTNLDFRHALTAIRFAVGQNLSWNKTIDRVELRNAVMQSRYNLSNKLDGSNAGWDITKDVRGTAVLSNVSVSTNANPNVTIMGNDGDNYTFYMIPMKNLTGVTAYVHCTDGTTITVPLKGEWKAGTTRTYKLSQINSTWTYVLTPTNPSRAAKYNETISKPYSVTSYRIDPVTKTQQAVPWKVIGYSVDYGATWTTTKPSWLTSLSKESGDGGSAAEEGYATLGTPTLIDMLAKRNKALQDAPALGSTAAPYDLSTNGGRQNRSTANSYLISAPGRYRIPLVYGNAITKGGYNTKAYQTGNTGSYVLTNFKDHNGNTLTTQWIETSNGGTNSGINGAEVVWADAANLVHLPANPIVRENGFAYLEFEVKKSDIQSGNAVVAIKKGNTVVWSWHLWFAPEDALDQIPVTNHQGVTYNFTKENLGWKPTMWKGTEYKSPRMVKVKVEQTIGNNGKKQVAVINIIQNPGNQIQGVNTFYQFGRKDAFPGVATSELKKGGILLEQYDSNMSLMKTIQNPNKFYTANRGLENPIAYYNLWSADNTQRIPYEQGNDNPVVKTVYDPCPVGFKMPACNAFTGFTENGQNRGVGNAVGIEDSFNFILDFGWNFWTDSNKNSTIFFPQTGFITDSGDLFNRNSSSVWTAVPNNTRQATRLFFNGDYVSPLNHYPREFGFSVRPVSE